MKMVVVVTDVEVEVISSFTRSDIAMADVSVLHIHEDSINLGHLVFTPFSRQTDLLALNWSVTCWLGSPSHE